MGLHLEARRRHSHELRPVQRHRPRRRLPLDHGAATTLRPSADLRSCVRPTRTTMR
jgi:hypothetical protein